MSLRNESTMFGANTNPSDLLSKEDKAKCIYDALCSTILNNHLFKMMDDKEAMEKIALLGRELNENPTLDTLNKAFALCQLSDTEQTDLLHVYSGALEILLCGHQEILTQQNLFRLGKIADSFDKHLRSEDKNKLFRDVLGERFGNEYAGNETETVKAMFGLIRSIGELGLMSFYLAMRKSNPQLSVLVLPKKAGCSMLHNAVTGGQFDLVNRLIQDGANLNLKSTFFFGDNSVDSWNAYSSPLHDAITTTLNNAIDTQHRNPERQQNMLKIIDLLLEKGADPHQPCLNHNTDHMYDSPFKVAEYISERIKTADGELKEMLNDKALTEGINKVITAGNEKALRLA